MALSQWDIDLENNKNVINGLTKKTRNFLSTLNTPSNDIAPNIYDKKDNINQTPNQQILPSLSKPQNRNPISIPVEISNQSEQAEQSNTRPTSMKLITPDGGLASVKSTRPFPTPGSTLLNAGDSSNPKAVPVTLSKLATAGNQPGITRGNGFEFQGTAEDAAKFMRPVNNINQEQLTGKMIAPRSPDYSFLKPDSERLDGLPKYLGPESGLGWKTRAKLYESQMDTYNKALGNQTALNLEAIRETGAGLRTLAQANQWNVENAINQKRLDSDTALSNIKQQREQLALNQENNIMAARDAFMKDPSAENKARLNALLIDPNRQKELRPKTHVIDQYGPAGEKTGQIIVDDEGTVVYGNQESKEHPAIAWLRNNNTEEGRKMFIDKYKQLPKDWKY